VSGLSRFARLLGLPAHQAEDALHSERAASAVLSRRSLFAASGAMAAGSCFSFGAPALAQSFMVLRDCGEWADFRVFYEPDGIRLSRAGYELSLASLDVDPRDMPPEVWNSL